jgi:hypothetical protein
LLRKTNQGLFVLKCKQPNKVSIDNQLIFCCCGKCMPPPPARALLAVGGRCRCHIWDVIATWYTWAHTCGCGGSRYLSRRFCRALPIPIGWWQCCHLTTHRTHESSCLGGAHMCLYDIYSYTNSLLHTSGHLIYRYIYVVSCSFACASCCLLGCELLLASRCDRV